MENWKWNPTGNRQGDGTARTPNGSSMPPTKRHRMMDRVRVFAGSVKWSYLELEDDLKCRFWKLFSSSRARCNAEDCPNCNPKPTDPELTPAQNGRLSILLQKIRTWPRFGSRKIRDHTSQDAQQPASGPAPKPDRRKAASFPVKRRDLSRARFLPRFKKFESIREESDHGGASVSAENQLPTENEPIFENVVGVELPGTEAQGTPSVDDLLSLSFGSDVSFGNQDSMNRDFSMPPDYRSNTMDHNIPTSAGTSEASVNALPVPQATNRAWDFPGSPLGVPAPAVSSEVSESAGPPPYEYGNANYFHSPSLIESSIPEACGTSQTPKSRYNGVRWKAKKWTSEIRPPNASKTVWLGTYTTEEEAASAFDAGIYYYGKPKDYNFPDSESMLPPLDPSMDDKKRTHFIKYQARVIAKARVERMAQTPGGTRREVPQVNSSPRTPDTSSSGAGPSGPSRSRLPFLPNLKRAKSGDEGLPKNSRPRNF